MKFLVRIVRETYSTEPFSITGPSFFAARAATAQAHGVDPADVRPAIRFTLGGAS